VCDPIWHVTDVSASSGVAMLHCELLYPYTLLCSTVKINLIIVYAECIFERCNRSVCQSKFVFWYELQRLQDFITVFFLFGLPMLPLNY